MLDLMITSARRRVAAYHMRAGDGHEIDLVLEVGTELWAVGVKLTTRPQPSHMARLRESADLIGARRRFLITRLPDTSVNGPDVLCDPPGMLAVIAEDKPG